MNVDGNPKKRGAVSGANEGKGDQMNKVFYIHVQDVIMKPIVLCKCFLLFVCFFETGHSII